MPHSASTICRTEMRAELRAAKSLTLPHFERIVSTAKQLSPDRTENRATLAEMDSLLDNVKDWDALLVRAPTLDPGCDLQARIVVGPVERPSACGDFDDALCIRGITLLAVLVLTFLRVMPEAGHET